MNCERCGGPRINGASVEKVFGPAADDVPDRYNLDVVLPPTPHPATENWCRSCVKFATGESDEDPLAQEVG